jgi:hypothetical protein
MSNSSSSSSSSSVHHRLSSRSSLDFSSFDSSTRSLSVERQLINRGKSALHACDQLVSGFLGPPDLLPSSFSAMMNEEDLLVRLGLSSHRIRSLTSTQDVLTGKLMENMRKTEKLHESLVNLEEEIKNTMEIMKGNGLKKSSGE